MRKLQSIALAAAVTTITTIGLAAIGTTASAKTATAGHTAQPVTAARSGSSAATVAANEQKVRAFLRDVIDQHHGDHAANYLNPGMQWSGGTVGTVTGRIPSP